METYDIQLFQGLDESLKEEVSEIGLTTSQAITMFLKGVKRERGIPFDLKIADEYKIASEISNALKNLKKGETRDLKELLNEL